MANSSDLFAVVILSGVMGMVGQSARVVIGLKKRSDANNSPTEPYIPFDSGRLAVSLVIGFVAGVATLLMGFDIQGMIDAKELFALAAGGYAGTDALEGFLGKMTSASLPRPPDLLSGTDAPGSLSGKIKPPSLPPPNLLSEKGDKLVQSGITTPVDSDSEKLLAVTNCIQYCLRKDSKIAKNQDVMSTDIFNTTYNIANGNAMDAFLTQVSSDLPNWKYKWDYKRPSGAVLTDYCTKTLDFMVDLITTAAKP